MIIPRIHPAEGLIALALFGGIAFVGLVAHLPPHALSAGPMLQNATPDGFTAVWWQSGRGPAELRVRGSADAETAFPARRTVPGSAWPAATRAPPRFQASRFRF